MATRLPNVYLLREEVEYTRNKNREQEFGSQYLFLDINELKNCIMKTLAKSYAKIENAKSSNVKTVKIETNNTKTGNFVDDYVFLCFMLGNDFVPHMPAISLRNKGLETLINTYMLAYYKINEHLIINNKINQPFLVYLLGKLSEIEDAGLLEYSKKRVKFEKRFINMTGVTDEFSKRIELRRHYPILNQREENLIDIGTKGWRNRYYSNLFNINTIEEIDEVCYNYLEGLKWTYDYYYLGCPSFHFSYNYYHPPSLKDLYSFLNKNKQFNINAIKFEKKAPVSPLVQLLSILPPESVNLLPKSAQDLMTDSESPIIYYYPNTFIYDTHYKRYFWQCSPILPMIDQNIIKDSVNNIKINSKDKKRFTRHKTIFIDNKDN